jgi:phage terminase large subunit-like protein
MKQSMSSRRQPLLTCITTNGFVRECIFDSQYEYAEGVLDSKIIDDRFIAFIYELDDRSEWQDESCWVKANPGIGTIKSTEFLRDCVNKAKVDPAFKPTVMVKDFNLKENSATRWLSWEVLENKEKFDFAKMKFKYGMGGFDAADTTDLNSAKALCMRPNDDRIYVKSMYWLPEDVLSQMTTDGKRTERDSVPYLLWERQGLLRSWSGNKVDKICFLEWFKELRDVDGMYVIYIGYDPWHIDDSLLRAFKAEFGERAMIPIRQGVATLSQPMLTLKADLKAKRIVYNDNPIDKWCLSNTEIKADINGNIQPVKGLDVKKRIDGLISLLCGYIVLHDFKDDYKNMI